MAAAAAATTVLFLLLLSVLAASSVHSSPSIRSRRPITRRFAGSPKPRNHAADLSPYSGHRYVLAENSAAASSKNRTGGVNSSISAAPAPAPGPSSSASNGGSSHRRSHKHRVRNWILGFTAGAVTGVASGLILSVLFRLLMNFIRGHYQNRTGATVFIPHLIRSTDDLAFLENFEEVSQLEIIGRGGSGEVYKKQLPPNPKIPDRPGTVIAIKRIKKHAIDSADPASDEESRLLDKWMRQIRSELNTVGHIRHRNLLPLLAHVSRPSCHYLIYEYMKNGSLESVLKRANEGTRVLDWHARHRIALGVAAGLEYLHVHHKPHIIHRDLKPANILLDDNMEARIADFGLAKEVPESNTHMSSSNVAGTLGYIAPEFYGTLKYTAKCDIYSFGVILAVLVVGKLPSDDFFQDTHEISMVKWLRNVMNSDNPGAAIDAKLAGNGDEEKMLLVLRIACFCTVDDPKERPNSKEVTTMLAQIEH